MNVEEYRHHLLNMPKPSYYVNRVPGVNAGGQVIMLGTEARQLVFQENYGRKCSICNRTLERAREEWHLAIMLAPIKEYHVCEKNCKECYIEYCPNNILSVELSDKWICSICLDEKITE